MYAWHRNAHRPLFSRAHGNRVSQIRKRRQSPVEHTAVKEHDLTLRLTTSQETTDWAADGRRHHGSESPPMLKTVITDNKDHSTN